MSLLGPPRIYDAEEAHSAGAFLLLDNLRPTNETRSDARRVYYDPYAGRPGFSVLALNQVMRILFENNGGTLHATGVEYAAASGTAVQSTTANKEFILAAGALHTPLVLQLSGIGPVGVFEQFGIPVLEDLPGVGANL